MTHIMRPLLELPLLGSNQDSPDPESSDSEGVIARSGLQSRENTPETQPNNPTSTHSFAHLDFPPRVFVTLERGEDGAETLRAAFAAEDCDEETVGVYQFTGALERRFVEVRPQIEQRRKEYGCLPEAR